VTQARSSDPKNHSLESFQARWDRSGSFEPAHCHAIRITILRALSRHFHSERSVLKAQPLAESTEASLSALEARVDRFSQLEDLATLTFEKLFSDPLPSAQTEKPLERAPARLRAGLERPDRRWERRIFRAAQSAHFSPSLMGCALPLSDIGAFHAHLETDFDPLGVCLWVDAGSKPAPVGHWSGQWWWMLRGNPPDLRVPAQWTALKDAR
jgi:hypothetical protein